MRDSVQRLLSDLHEAGRRFDAAQPDRLDRLRNLEPESGALLNLLMRALGAHDVLELGTSNGVSTVWLAEALAATGGRLVSVELDAGRSRDAGRTSRGRASTASSSSAPVMRRTRCATRPTPPGTSCSSTPSARSTRATGRISPA